MDKINFKHIVLISLDCLRADCITSVAKNDFLKKYSPLTGFKTKILDELIKKGILFDNCISAAPYTAASHAAIFSGCWPRENGVYEFFNRRIVKPTLFELAKQSGFTTIFQTDFPIILGGGLGITRGVDRYFIENENKAFNSLLKNKNKNTVSFFHFGGVHYPYGFHKLKFAPTDYPRKVEVLEKAFNINRKREVEDFLDESYRDSQDKQLLLRYKNIIEELYKKKRYEDLNALYIEGVDYFMKHRFNLFAQKILDFVDNNNALLIIFSDHGEQWDEKSKGHSNSISDAVIRVPLIFYSKQIPKNVRISKLARTIDIVPTICNYSSINSSKFDGKPLDFFESKNNEEDRVAFAQVWRVGDKKKIHSHQQKILQNKCMIKPLKTHLEKEAVYYKKNIINREYSRDGTLIKESFFRYKEGMVLPASKLAKKEVNLLRKILKQYNLIKYKKNNKIKSVSNQIVEDLKLLGYRI